MDWQESFAPGDMSLQVGVDMSRFREFPYRGSLLQSQSGGVQEVQPSLLTHHSRSHGCP